MAVSCFAGGLEHERGDSAQPRSSKGGGCRGWRPAPRHARAASFISGEPTGSFSVKYAPKPLLLPLAHLRENIQGNRSWRARFHGLGAAKVAMTGWNEAGGGGWWIEKLLYDRSPSAACRATESGTMDTAEDQQRHEPQDTADLRPRHPGTLAARHLCAFGNRVLAP
jgi:hypothetical protein